MGKFMVGAIVFTVVINAVIVWVAGSAITSGVKSLSDDCGKTYPVEAVFSGDWFCAD